MGITLDLSLKGAHEHANTAMGLPHPKVAAGFTA